ncbi:MAG: CRISPR system precrRNA processing endoribonuclease RAMP protein Cas6 [Acidobacteria bacterium]|nr:MAG: CRISPR system precrRNA processing endoribonuclease RAMP protein Cas6 [Acidobacteriota bacterium]
MRAGRAGSAARPGASVRRRAERCRARRPAAPRPSSRAVSPIARSGGKAPGPDPSPRRHRVGCARWWPPQCPEGASRSGDPGRRRPHGGPGPVQYPRSGRRSRGRAAGPASCGGGRRMAQEHPGGGMADRLAAYRRALESVPMVTIRAAWSWPVRAPRAAGGPLVRSALGRELRRLTHGDDAGPEPLPAGCSCPYCAMFERRSVPGGARRDSSGWVSGLDSAPATWRMRCSRRDWDRGSFAIDLYGPSAERWALVVAAIEGMARRGLGGDRVRPRSLKIACDAMNGVPASLGRRIEDCEERLAGADSVRLVCATPLRLLRKGDLVITPSPGLIATSAARRAAALAALAGARPVPGPPTDVLNDAREIPFGVAGGWRRVAVTRYSARQGRRHPLEGCVGQLAIECAPADVLALLAAGSVSGVGKGLTFGFGTYRLVADDEPCAGPGTDGNRRSSGGTGPPNATS